MSPSNQGHTLILVTGAPGNLGSILARRGEVIGAAATAQLWAKAAGCQLTVSELSLPTAVSDGTSATRVEYPGCRAGTRVVLDRVNGGGHAWPGGVPYLGERLIGKTSANLSASDEIWGFFAGLK